MSIIFTPIRIIRGGETTPSRHWRWTCESMPDYDLVILQKGKAVYTDGEASWSVSPGSCMFFRRGAKYSGIQEQDNPVSMIFIHFDFLNRKKHPISVPSAELLPVHFRIDHHDFVSTLARRTIQAHNAKTDNSNAEVARLWLRTLWTELTQQLKTPRWQGTELEQAQQVEALCLNIRNRIHQPWRLPDIAEALHCGPENASRRFRKYKGIPPGEFVLRIRTEVAQALLSSSTQSITQIAEALGYCDVYAFSRQFSQRTGYSPREFRLLVSGRK